MANPTCDDRIGGEFAGTMKTVRRLWKWEQKGRGDEPHPKEETNLNEYGLCADWVAPDTFNDQPTGFFRWQLSWGGPSDEFRFHGLSLTACGLVPDRIEYRFHDWYDGAGVDLEGADFDLLASIFDYFWPEPQVTIEAAE